MRRGSYVGEVAVAAALAAYVTRPQGRSRRAPQQHPRLNYRQRRRGRK